MKLIFGILAALALFALPACDTLRGLVGLSPDVIESAAPEERAPLTVIALSLTVKGAYQTLEEGLDSGLIAPAEAIAVKRQVDTAAEAVRAAGLAVEAGGGKGELALADELVRAFLTSSLFAKRPIEEGEL